MAQRKRQVLLETAIRLFSERGFHATGIDLIAKEANVSKKTMYEYFRSKEALILAALQEHDRAFSQHLDEALSESSVETEDKLLVIFDIAYEWFQSDAFSGCLFMSALSEYESLDSEIQSVCSGVKQSMRNRIEHLLNDSDLPDPTVLAGALTLVYEGAIVRAQAEKNPGVALEARGVAALLIANADQLA